MLDEVRGEEILALTNLTGGGAAYRVLTDLGAPLAPSADEYADGESAFVTISRELIAGLDADVIFIAPPYTDLINDPATPISPDLLELLGATRAARADQLLTVGLAWTSTNVAALPLILDDLERFLDQRPDAFFTTA